MTEQKPKQKLKPEAKKWLKLLGKIGIFALAMVIIFQFVFGFKYLRSNSMFPALRDGDFIISYKLETAVKNDVVLYKHDDETKVGRIVATAGDTVAFSTSGELLVNGCVSTEEIFYATTPATNSDIEYPYTVPENSVFILNDYRSSDFNDSRTYGAISLGDLQGKAFFIFRRRGF